jgi:hypothetical protein
LIHNFVRVEEKKVVVGKLQIDKGGYSLKDDDPTILKYVKFSKKVKIDA